MELKDLPPLDRLREIARILRAENGCPWDREQTLSSLKTYLIEEAYEVYDAIESGSMDDLREELGDLLYQVYAQSEIANEDSHFTVDDVAEGISEKLIRRHPHVFGDESINDARGVKVRWEKIKKQEKAAERSILAGVPRYLPALAMALRVQDKVSHVGFDWEKIDDAIAKLDEEIAEFKDAVKLNEADKISEEAGDILFSIVNVLRFKKIDAEDSLRRTVDKFIKRFKFIEKEVSGQGKSIERMSLEELDRLWEKSKINT